MEAQLRIESVWRYPVKSMRGEPLEQAFAGFSGIYGDRWCAIVSSGLIKGFPYLTAREKAPVLLCQPVYRYPEWMTQPPNLVEAEALGPRVTPLYGEAADAGLDAIHVI